MKPGDTANGTVDIKNTGTLAGAFSLSKTVTAETASFASKLTVVITDNGDPACVDELPGRIAGLVRHHRGDGYPLARHLRRRRHPPLHLRGHLPGRRRQRRGQRLPGRHRDGDLQLDRGLLTGEPSGRVRR